MKNLLVATALLAGFGEGSIRLIQSSAKPEPQLVPPLMEHLIKATAAATATLGPPTGLWERGRHRKLSTRVS